MKSETARKRRRRRQAPPPPTPTRLVRISGDLIDRVDAVRPEMIPREPFIRHLLDEKLKEYEQEEEE